MGGKLFQRVHLAAAARPPQGHHHQQLLHGHAAREAVQVRGNVLYCNVLHCTVLYFTVLYCTVTVQVRGAAADPRPRGGADGLHRLARQSRRQRDPRGAQVPRFRRQGRILW